MAAPTGATLAATLSSILKEFYLPPVVEQLNNDVLLLQRLESRSEELFGKAAFVPVHTGRSGGIGARGESELLPDAGNQAYLRAQYDLKYLYGRVRVTGPSMLKTQSEAGAFLQALKSELDGIRNDLKKDLARQIYGDGTGSITQCGVTTAANVVVLSTFSSAGQTYNEALSKGQLYVGMLVDIGTAASVRSVASARSITAIDLVNKTITISGAAVTTSASHFVFRAGDPNGAATTQEITGLQAFITPTAPTAGGQQLPGGIDGFNVPLWDSLRDVSGGLLSMDKLMSAFNRVRQNGGQTSLMIGSLGIQRAYFNLFTQTTKFTEPTKLQGGYSALTFMDKPFVADIDAPVGKLFLIDERYFKVFSPGDWSFLDQDGDTLKWTVGYDAWEAVLARYLNLGATRRNTQMVLTGIQVTSGNADPGF